LLPVGGLVWLLCHALLSIPCRWQPPDALHWFYYSYIACFR
jgi:hypothetical protein